MLHRTTNGDFAWAHFQTYIGKLISGVQGCRSCEVFPNLIPARLNASTLVFLCFSTEESIKTRLHIGGGIRLELVGEGDLYLECLSNYSVFVESFYLDAINNRAPGSTVHKFSSGANTKVVVNH